LENYFNYFTEIEEHFQRRRGSLLLLSTLDWALIETWREAGIPLEAVLRGIDSAFDKYDARKSKGNHRRVNGLAYCAQAVMTAVEDMKEASVGAPAKAESNRAELNQEGFEQERIAAHLAACAERMHAAAIIGQKTGTGAAGYLIEAAQRLEALALDARRVDPNLQELEGQLTAIEERLFATLISTTPEDDLVTLRQQASRELEPYRSRMQAMQIRQIERQFLHKRLLEKLSLPRLSLFYMSQS
jgi:electron transfer flavoprotein alpha subunit